MKRNKPVLGRSILKFLNLKFLLFHFSFCWGKESRKCAVSETGCKKGSHINFPGKHILCWNKRKMGIPFPSLHDHFSLSARLTVPKWPCKSFFFPFYFLGPSKSSQEFENVKLNAPNGQSFSSIRQVLRYKTAGGEKSCWSAVGGIL